MALSPVPRRNVLTQKQLIGEEWDRWLTALVNQVNTLTTDTAGIPAMQADITALQAAVATLTTDLGTLSGTVTTLSGTVSTLSSDLTALTAQVNAIPLSVTWTDIAYSAGNFTASSSTWGVDSGDQIVYRYGPVMNTVLLLNVVIQASDVGAGNAELRVALPSGMTVTTTSYFEHKYTDAGGIAAVGWGLATAGNSYVGLHTLTGGNWTNTSADDTAVAFLITLEAA